MIDGSQGYDYYPRTWPVVLISGTTLHRAVLLCSLSLRIFALGDCRC
jgi:hypothetical protein